MKTLDVHIGEVKIARKGELLKAILGSCVGIGFIWKERGICGLAHCLLPASPEPTYAIGGRFVDQAIHSLIALMKIKKEDIQEIQAIVTGGGNMTHPGVSDPERLIGEHNFRLAKKMVAEMGFKIVHSESGGEEGRKIFIDSLNFSYRVEKIPRLIKAV